MENDKLFLETLACNLFTMKALLAEKPKAEARGAPAFGWPPFAS